MGSRRWLYFGRNRRKAKISGYFIALDFWENSLYSSNTLYSSYTRTMNQNFYTIVICVGLIILLTGCEKSSRFDEAAVVDVCNILSKEEASKILGSLYELPTSDDNARNMAGTCKWSFKSLVAGKDKGILSVMLVTEGSNGGIQDLDAWFKLSIEEVKVSLYAYPWQMNDIGNKAYLFQAKRPDYSELWMYQGKTYLFMRMDGGSSSQLYEFAKAFSRELEPKESK